MALSYDKKQMQYAKEKSLPLCTISFDDRHLPKPTGKDKRVGSMTFQGPMNPKSAKKLLDFMCKIIAEDCQSKE